MNKNKSTIPKWIRKIIIASRARESYFLKRYGNLNRMRDIDKKFQDQLDEDSFYDENPHLKP